MHIRIEAAFFLEGREPGSECGPAAVMRQEVLLEHQFQVCDDPAKEVDQT